MENVSEKVNERVTKLAKINRCMCALLKKEHSSFERAATRYGCEVMPVLDVFYKGGMTSETPEAGIFL